MIIKCLKLIGGEEIVFDYQGTATVEGVRCHIVQNVVAFQMLRHPETGQPIEGFGEWPKLAMPGQVQHIPLTSAINMPLDANEELARHYHQSITGIQLPPVQKILLS
jgi:hypothetical protein